LYILLFLLQIKEIAVAENKKLRDLWNKQIAAKEQEYAKVSSDLEEATTQDNQDKFFKKAERIAREIDELHKKLSDLDKNSLISNVRYTNIEKSFQKIDFAEARKIVQSIKIQFADTSGAILLFLQRSTKQKGDYCIKEVLDLIVDERKIGDNIIGDFRPYPVDLGSQISEFYQSEFSKRLASHLGDDSDSNLPSIIKKLCSSLRGGSIVFIEIKNWDNVIDPKSFLNWFMDSFWQPLVDELDLVFLEYSKIRLIVALIAKSNVSSVCSDLSDCFCTMDAFDKRKIIEIPLLDWTTKDIQNWLINFKGLSNPISRQKADEIYRESEGTPSVICSILDKEFKV
jgi:inactive STAND